MTHCIQIFQELPVWRLQLPAWLAKALRNLGPYLLMELLLPGGTAVALLLWFFRKNGWRISLHATGQNVTKT